MGRASLIMVLGSILAFMLVTTNVNTSISRASDYTIDYFAHTNKRNIANSVAEMLLAQLGDNNSFRANSQVTLSGVFDGSATYRVVDTTIAGQARIKVVVNSNYLNRAQRTTVIAVGQKGPSFSPVTVKAAITTNNPVHTLGTLIVDGRDHLMDGSLVPNSGTAGIWSTNTITVGGASKVGGTVGGVDSSPKKHYDPGTVLPSQVWPGGYPTTPDSIMGGKANGYPDGTLKSIAQSGALGSQYVTDPALLSFPISGVTYVELPAGSSWIAANITGEGILVVHNSALNAVIKNSNIGPFKGIMIADDVDKIHTDIVGAVIAMSPWPPSGNTIGNGTGRVMFSSESIRNATSQADPEILNQYGFSRKRIRIISWLE